MPKPKKSLRLDGVEYTFGFYAFCGKGSFVNFKFQINYSMFLLNRSPPSLAMRTKSSNDIPAIFSCLFGGQFTYVIKSDILFWPAFKANLFSRLSQVIGTAAFNTLHELVFQFR